MFPGLGGKMGKMDPKQMQRAMKMLGIKSTEIEAKKVIIETADKKIVIEPAAVTEIEMQGQKSYQIAGETREEKAGIPSEDIELVMEQTNCSKEKAEKALKESNGDIAEAITKLKK